MLWNENLLIFFSWKLTKITKLSHTQQIKFKGQLTREKNCKKNKEPREGSALNIDYKARAFLEVQK
jgi:hypothetical protein